MPMDPDAWVESSGFRIDTVPPGPELTATATRSLAEAEKVNRPFCPGTLVEICTPVAVASPAVMVPVKSAGTLYSVRVVVPVAVPVGSTTMEYVPVRESTGGSSSTVRMPMADCAATERSG